MIRYLAAALLFVGAAAPAFACDWNKSAATTLDNQQTTTVASQPAIGTTTTPSTTTTPKPDIYNPS